MNLKGANIRIVPYARCCGVSTETVEPKRAAKNATARSSTATKEGAPKPRKRETGIGSLTPPPAPPSPTPLIVMLPVFYELLCKVNKSIEA